MLALSIADRSLFCPPSSALGTESHPVGILLMVFSPSAALNNAPPERCMKRHCAIGHWTWHVVFFGATGQGSAATIFCHPHEGGVTLFACGLSTPTGSCGFVYVRERLRTSGAAALSRLPLTLLHRTGSYADHVALEGFPHLGEHIEDSRLYSAWVLWAVAAQLDALTR